MRSLAIFFCGAFALLWSSGSVQARDIEFAAPDKKAVAAIKMALGARLKHDMEDTLAWENYSKSIRKSVTSAWIRIDNQEPPYLFVSITPECGASDCTIIGLRPVGTGWVKVYERLGGEGVTVLDKKTNGHRDLSQDMTEGEGHWVTYVSRWSNDHYEKASETQN